MIIGRKSPVTGLVTHLDLDITQAHLDLWQGGEYIQHVMPNLTVDEREFLMTGRVGDDWETMT